MDAPAFFISEADMAETFLFHRYQNEWIFANGTADQAREYWQHLNSGRVDNLWSVRRHGGKSRGVNLSTELDRIAKEQTHIVSPRHDSKTSQ